MGDTVRLKLFRSEDETVLLDTASGTVAEESQAHTGLPSDVRSVGYVDWFGEQTVAIYVLDARVYVQHPDRQIELAEMRGLPFTWERIGDGGRNRVTFQTRSGDSHSIVYASAAVEGRVDPTFDAMDEEMEDLFLFLFRVAGSRMELMEQLVRQTGRSSR